MNRSAILFCFILFSLSFETISARSAPKPEGATGESVQDENSEKKVQFHIRPSLGLTFGDSNASGIRVTNLQWLGTLNSDFDYIGKKFDLSSTLFMQYGESKVKGHCFLKRRLKPIWVKEQLMVSQPVFLIRCFCIKHFFWVKNIILIRKRIILHGNLPMDLAMPFNKP